jgi:hypothetical protein
MNERKFYFTRVYYTHSKAEKSVALKFTYKLEYIYIQNR